MSLKNKQVVRQFQYRSSRDASIIYSTLLYSDGTASCNCPGWARHVGKDGARTCKHLISAGIAPVSESVSAKKQLQQTAGKKVLRHGESAQMSMRTVRKFRFEDED